MTNSKNPSRLVRVLDNQKRRVLTDRLVAFGLLFGLLVSAAALF